MRGNNVELPHVILTDRELAHVKYLSHYFPESGHTLCAWHVHKNVEHHSKTEFPMPIEKGVNHSKHQEFVDARNCYFTHQLVKYMKIGFVNLRNLAFLSQLLNILKKHGYFGRRISSVFGQMQNPIFKTKIHLV